MHLPTKILSSIVFFTIPFSSFAISKPIDDFIAISAYLGGRYSQDMKDSETGDEAEISNDYSQALALSWYYDRNKEGELLYSQSKQNFNLEEKDISTDLYISYLHFGGRVIYDYDNPFSTSFGMGIGATFFIPDDSQYDKDIAFSGNITGGVRYEINKQWALKADLRFYGTIINNSSSLFCSNNQCLIEVSGDVYVQTELMAGVEYKF